MYTDRKRKEIIDIYNDLDLDGKKKLYKIAQSKNDAEYLKYKKEIDLAIYKKNPPPTAEQFLDPSNGWISKSLADSIYDYVKEDFIEIINNSDKYWCIIFYGSTRIGKSWILRLIILYTFVYIHHLRYPSMFFGLSPETEMSIYNLSFNLAKTKELLISKIFNLMKMSERFVKVKFQDKVTDEQYKLGSEYIVYSKAADSGFITLDTNLLFMSSNKSPLKILGSDMIQAYFTELSFWEEDAGANPAEIYRLVTDAIDRLEATVGNLYQPLTWIFIDTSANETDNIVEKYIMELKDQPGVFFRWRSRWDARPYLFPTWQKTGETFKVITGDGSTPAAIVYDEKQLKGISDDIVDEVPIDALPRYEANLIKSIKDIGGKPSSSEAKFIQRKELIDGIFDNDTLCNIEGAVIANAENNPDKLIWNQICDEFFVKYGNSSYIPKRAPRELRWFGADFAYCVDITTEIFTQRGWLKYDEVKIGDMTLGLDSESHIAKWVSITDVNIFESKPRKMLSIENKSHSSLSTMDHKWLVRDGNKNNVVLSKDLNTNHKIIKSAMIEGIFWVPLKKDIFVELVPDDMKEVEYSGKVWCPTTKNGSWFARRNGTTYYTGNSEKGDVVGLSIIHKEWSTKLKEVVYVADFSFAVVSEKDEINLGAIRTFANDVKILGNTTIKGYAVDGFSSQETIQYCKRKGIEAERQSVDSSLDPYLFLLGCMLSNTLKVGKNIFLKNNLNSLYRMANMNTKSKGKKIDHKKGKTDNKYFGDFNGSKCGQNAKDISDSLTQAVYVAQNDNYIPSTCYEKENERLKEIKDKVIKESTVKDIFQILHKNY